MKRIGPNPEPRGTPQERLETCEMWSLTMTDCVVFVREEENQESAVPEMPYMCWSLSRSMQWSIVSKAAEMIQECQKRNIAGVKCKKDVICYFEKGCFSAMVRAVSGLRRTDEPLFKEIG